MVVIMVVMVVVAGHIGKIDEIMAMSRGGAPGGNRLCDRACNLQAPRNHPDQYPWWLALG
jgi:hypothetical protein